MRKPSLIVAVFALTLTHLSSGWAQVKVSGGLNPETASAEVSATTADPSASVTDIHNAGTGSVYTDAAPMSGVSPFATIGGSTETTDAEATQPNMLLSLLPALPAVLPVFGGLFNSTPEDAKNPMDPTGRPNPYAPPSSSIKPIPMTGEEHWSEDWQIAFMNHLNDNCGAKLRTFRSQDGDGLAKICGAQNLIEMTQTEKNLVLMALFENVAFEESSNNPGLKGLKSPKNNGLFPHGLFQLDKDSMAGYKSHKTKDGALCCPINNDEKTRSDSESSSYNAVASIKCAVTIVNHNTKDGVYSRGQNASDTIGAFKYWQPMQGQDQEKKDRIYGKSIDFCKKLVLAKRAGSDLSPEQLSAALGVSTTVVQAASGVNSTPARSTATEAAPKENVQ